MITAYLDECVNPNIAASIESGNVRVVTARDVGMLGRSDEAQLEFAAKNDWVLVTVNSRHFFRLAKEFERSGRDYTGIILRS